MHFRAKCTFYFKSVNYKILYLRLHVRGSKTKSEQKLLFQLHCIKFLKVADLNTTSQLVYVKEDQVRVLEDHENFIYEKSAMRFFTQACDIDTIKCQEV